MNLTEQRHTSVIQRSQKIWKNLYGAISDFEKELVWVNREKLSDEQIRRLTDVLNSLKSIRNALNKRDPQNISDSSGILELDMKFFNVTSSADEFIIRLRFETICPDIIKSVNQILLIADCSNLLPSEIIWIKRIKDLIEKYSRNITKEHLGFIENNINTRLREIKAKLNLEYDTYQKEFQENFGNINKLNSPKLSKIVKKINNRFNKLNKFEDLPKLKSLVLEIKKYVPEENKHNEQINCVNKSFDEAVKLFEDLSTHHLIDMPMPELTPDMREISGFLNNINTNIYEKFISKCKTHDNIISEPKQKSVLASSPKPPKETFIEKALKPVKKIVNTIRIEDRLKKIKNLQPENPDQWLELYRKYYETERLAEKENKMKDFQDKFNELEDEINNQFAKYYLENYPGWLKGTSNNAPMLSHEVFKKVKSKKRNTYYLIIDGMRYDQWLYIKDDLSTQILQNYKLADFKDYYFSVIPTVTEIARKSLIGGKKFSEISKGNSDDYLLKSLFSTRTMMSSYNSDKSWRTFDVMSLKENNPEVLVIRIQNLDNMIHMFQETNNPMNTGKLLGHFQSEMKNDIYRLISELVAFNSRIVITADHGCIITREQQKVEFKDISLRERYFVKSKARNFIINNIYTIAGSEIGMPEINYDKDQPEIPHEYCFMKAPYISPKKNQISPNSVTHGGVSLNECVVPLAVFDPV